MRAAQSIADWATGLSAGPEDEQDTTPVFSFVVTNDNTGLFKAEPSVAADGTLTYTPSADASGKAMVTVTLHDAGGTTHGRCRRPPRPIRS